MFGGTAQAQGFICGGTAQAEGLLCLAAQHKHKDYYVWRHRHKG